MSENSAHATNPEEELRRTKIRDMNKFLPFGETLRGYLEHSFVTVGDLSELLRSRGVFVQGAKKEDLVFILIATLISPSEFQTLLDCRRDRDSKEKVFHRTRSWKSGRNLQEAANAAVKLEALAFKETEKCKLLGKPVISTVNGNPDEVEIAFTVQRTNMSLDWCDEDSQHSGKVALKKEKVDDKVTVTITHTSPETKDYAEKYAKLIEESLRASGDIGDPTADDQILFSSFENVQRADFFLSLTGSCGHNELVFERSTHLDALTVQDIEVPENCRELVEGLQQLKLRGELHKSAYLRKREIYPYIHFYRMDVRYKFFVAGAEGICAVRYEFVDFGSSGNPTSEFAHEVEIVSLGDKFKHISKSNVKKSLQELIARLVNSKFKQRAQKAEQPTNSSSTDGKGAVSLKSAARTQARSAATEPAAETIELFQSE